MNDEQPRIAQQDKEPAQPEYAEDNLHADLTSVLRRHNTNPTTPHDIVASYLIACMTALDVACAERNAHFVNPPNDSDTNN